MAAPALRLKTHWFKPERPKSPQETAGAMAFIAWRVAVQMLKRMRLAHFDIEAGPPYFDFLREVLVFELAAIDRMAHARMAPDERLDFITVLVLRTADHLHGNQQDLLGEAPGDCWRDRFIDFYNTRIADYAYCAWLQQAGAEGPDPAFVRQLGVHLEATLPEKDRQWVMDQVMSIEVPDAIALLRKGMTDVHSRSPAAGRRAAVAGD